MVFVSGKNKNIFVADSVNVGSTVAFIRTCYDGYWLADYLFFNPINGLKQIDFTGCFMVELA